MISDLDFQQAIEAGKRNLEAKQLIHNWCRHARVEKFGGTGLIEAQTGLPIGHHAMVCDYSSGSTWATHLLEMSAVQFHDRHCVNCAHRQAVALPNISKLVAERDHQRNLDQVRQEEAQRAKDSALRKRSEERAALRDSLPLVSHSFLDDLQAFDEGRSSELEVQLIESIRLAPEILAPKLVEHLFSLLDSNERWFDRIALTILSIAPSVDGRLVKAAMQCLASGHALDVAAAIVEKAPKLVDKGDVAAAMWGLSYVACPPPAEFSHGESKPDKPEALTAVSALFPKEAEHGLASLLSSRDAFRTRTAARAIAFLIAMEASWADKFTRSLSAHLSRIDFLVDAKRDSELRSVCHDLKRALSRAMIARPEQTDKELMRQFESASPGGEGRLAAVYGHVIGRVGRGKSASPTIADPAPYRTALRRLAALAETSENAEVSQEILSALRHPDPSLFPLAKELIDLFLGTAALLDVRRNAPASNSPLITAPNPLAEMERTNRLSTLWYLRSAFIEMAVRGALVDGEGLHSFETFLARREALGDSLSAAIVEEISPLLETSAGLRAMLPYLYAAMVGPSTLARASSAKAIEGIGSRRRSELPSLVVEALHLMLHDPYVIVHKAAVKAISRTGLSDTYASYSRAALQNLIFAYREDEDQEFLLSCIEAFIRTTRGEEQLHTRDGPIMVALLSRMAPSVILSGGHHYFIKRLCGVDGYTELVLYLLANCQTEYEAEHALELVRTIGPGYSAKHAESFIATFEQNASDMHVCGTFVELLTQDLHWSGALEVARRRAGTFSDLPRDRTQKLFAKQLEWRIEFEHLLSQGRVDEAILTGDSWLAAEDEIRRIREQDERSDTFRPIFPSA